MLPCSHSYLNMQNDMTWDHDTEMLIMTMYLKQKFAMNHIKIGFQGRLMNKELGEFLHRLSSHCKVYKECHLFIFQMFLKTTQNCANTLIVLQKHRLSQGECGPELFKYAERWFMWLWQCIKLWEWKSMQTAREKHLIFNVHIVGLNIPAVAQLSITVFFIISTPAFTP